METKQNIRNNIFQKRKAAASDLLLAASHKIFEKIIALPAFQNAAYIYTYIDYNNEVKTREIIEYAWRSKKKVAAPRVEGKELIFYEITSFDHLKPGAYGIDEPENCFKADAQDAFIIVPGVAFDRQRHRVGYGGGFYDRFLTRHPDYIAAAVAFDFQIMDQVPADAFDVIPDILVTESQMFQDYASR